MASDGGNGKQVRFSFAIDNSSVQSVMRSLRDLTQQAEKFAKAMQGAGSAMTGGFFSGGVGGKAPTPGQAATKMSVGPGGGGGNTAISNVVLENAKAFRSMATMGGDALKSMQDVLKKSVDEQKRSLTDLDRTIAKLGQSYQQLQRAQQAATGGAGGGSTAAMAAMAGQLAQAQGARVTAAAQLAQTQGMLPAQAQGGGGLFGRIGGFFGGMGGAIGAGYQQGGFLGALNANLGGPGLGTGMLGGVMQSVGLGGLALMAGPAALGYLGKVAFDESRIGSRMYSDQLVSRGAVLNPIVSQLKRGDTSFLAKQRFMMQDPALKEELRAQFQGMGADIEAFVGSDGSLLNKSARLANKVGLTGGYKGAGGTLDPATETALMKAYTNQVEKAGGMMEFQQGHGAFLEMMDQTQGSRTSMALGGGPKITYDPKTGRYTDRYLRRSADLTERGFNIEGEQAHRMQMQAMAGKEGRKYAFQAYSAAEGGYAGYGSLVSQSLRRGRGDELAQLAIGGRIDKNAGIEFGMGLMQSDPYGIYGVEGRMLAAQQSGAFKGKAADFQTSARMQAGIEGLNAITQGSTGYQKGANLLSAVKVAGPGASFRTQDYLASMDSGAMIEAIKTGKVSDRARRMGVSADMVKSQFGEMLQSAAFQAIPTDAKDPMSVALRGWKQSGKSLIDRIKDLGPNTEEAKTLLDAAQDAGGIDEAHSVGMQELFPGIIAKNAKGKKGTVGAGKVDPVTAARLKTQADRQRELAGLSESEAAGHIADQTAAPGAAKSFQSAGENLATTTDKLTASMAKLNIAVINLTANMITDPKARKEFLNNALNGDPNAKQTKPTAVHFIEGKMTEVKGN